MKIAKAKPRKVRNWQAVNAHFRKAGSHKGSKAEQNKRACRGVIRTEQ